MDTVLITDKVTNLDAHASIPGYVLFEPQIYTPGNHTLIEFVVVGTNHKNKTSYHVRVVVWGEERAIPLIEKLQKGRSLVLYGRLEINIKPPSKTRDLPLLEFKMVNPHIEILSMSAKSQKKNGGEYYSLNTIPV